MDLASSNVNRRDIEGLRAIAVLAVLLNHTAPAALSGGFVGVDVFFVISGYLIGSHLLSDIQQGTFSFLRFYGRRARRLFPALAVTLISVWSLGWMILSGPEFTDLGKHIAAAAIFSNNILLWFQSGYFDASSTAKPLLHLWSLGIEEQFYLLVPFLLWLSSSGRNASIRWVLLVSAISLLLTVIYPTPSFYLLDTRFWELGVGVIIGYLTLPNSIATSSAREASQVRHRTRNATLVCSAALTFACALAFMAAEDPWVRPNALRTLGLVGLVGCAAMLAWLVSSTSQPAPFVLAAARLRSAHRSRELAGAIGLSLCCLSLVAISPLNWPGAQTLFPVLGAGLIIIAGPFSPVNRILGSRPLVFIGGISYPLYLWHWPLIVFWKTFALEPTRPGIWVPVISAFLLAWLTKTLIEDPIRFGSLGAWRWRPPAIKFVVFGLAIVGAVGLSTVITRGYPMRFPPNLRAIADWAAATSVESHWREGRCFFRPTDRTPYAAECTPPTQPGTQRVLLWGDSHAAHLYPGIRSLRSKYAFDLIQWTSAGCPPSRTAISGEEKSCAGRRLRAVADLRDSVPDTVLLAASWSRYLNRGSSQAEIVAAVDDTITWLRMIGVKHIVLFGPGPSWVISEPTDVFMYMLRNRTDDIPERLEHVPPTVRQLDNALSKAASTRGIDYISIVDRLCNQDGCLVVADRHALRPDLLFQDQDHLTVSGSRFLLSMIGPQILASADTDRRPR